MTPETFEAVFHLLGACTSIAVAAFLPLLQALREGARRATEGGPVTLTLSESDTLALLDTVERISTRSGCAWIAPESSPGSRAAERPLRLVSRAG